MDTDTQNRRRNYFIKKKFQASFIVRFSAAVIIGALLAAIIVYYATSSTVTTTFKNSRLTMMSTADYILPAVLLSGAAMLIFVAVSTIIIMLFTSHKIAGPLYRMEKDVEEVARGNLTKRFKLRTTDELKELAKDLDEMAQTFRGNIAEIKRLVNDIESAGCSPEIRDKLELVKKALSKFNT